MINIERRKSGVCGARVNDTEYILYQGAFANEEQQESLLACQSRKQANASTGHGVEDFLTGATERRGGGGGGHSYWDSGGHGEAGG